MQIRIRQFGFVSCLVVWLVRLGGGRTHIIRSLEPHSPRCVWWQVAACSASSVTAAHHRSSSHKQGTHHSFGASIARSILEGQFVLAFSTRAYLTGESNLSSQLVPAENLCKATTPRSSTLFSLIQTVSTLHVWSRSRIPPTFHRDQGDSLIANEHSREAIIA